MESDARLVGRSLLASVQREQRSPFRAEFGYALPIGSGVELVPAAVLGASLPIGADGGALRVGAGGPLGLSVRLDEGVRFVVEPSAGRVFDQGQRTFSLSLKMFGSR